MLNVLFGVTMITLFTFLIMPPAATFGSTYQTPVTVVDKYYIEKDNNEYYIVVEYYNKYPYFEVPRRMYRTAQIGDTLMLYEGESILGVRWSGLYEMR